MQLFLPTPDILLAEPSPALLESPYISTYVPQEDPITIISYNQNQCPPKTIDQVSEDEQQDKKPRGETYEVSGL